MRSMLAFVFGPAEQRVLVRRSSFGLSALRLSLGKGLSFIVGLSSSFLSRAYVALCMGPLPGFLGKVLGFVGVGWGCRVQMRDSYLDEPRSLSFEPNSKIFPSAA